MKKVAVISYHKNIEAIYPKAWIDRYRKSILNQTYKDFDIYEVDYGGGNERIFENSDYVSTDFPTFIDAMNYLLDELKDYDAVANSNCDDWYDIKRLEVQLPYISNGFDIVSSNFALIKENKEKLRHSFHNLDITRELIRGNNIIAHPAVIYSKKFMETMRYDPAEIPREDMMLWMRTIIEGMNIKIVPECLLFHRIHENSVCNSSNR